MSELILKSHFRGFLNYLMLKKHISSLVHISKRHRISAKL